MESDETIYQHVYQNTVCGVLIIYDLVDRLVFFSIMCTLAKRYDVKIIAFSLMPDHYHMLIAARNRGKIAMFINVLDSVFAKAFNRSMNRKGRLFNKRFGCAPKKTIKEIVSTINYILDNPLVKRLDTKVEQSRWNLLAYADNPNPFSEHIKQGSASKALRKAIKAVDTVMENERWLTYDLLYKLFDSLSDIEINQLADHTVSAFNIIDYGTASEFYGSIGKMVLAANYNSGSESAISEVFESKDDRIYDKISFFLTHQAGFKTIKEVFTTTPEQRKRISDYIKLNTLASARELEKFLQLPDGTLYTKTEKHIRVKSHKRVIPIKESRLQAVGYQ